MVKTSSTAAQRRTTRSRRTVSARQRPAAKQRSTRRRTVRRYRQPYVGDMSLGDPFYAIPTPRRSAERNAIINEYANAVLLGDVRQALAEGLGRQPKWSPVEAAAIKKLEFDAEGKTHVEQALAFVASVYVLDLAHEVSDKLLADIRTIKQSGRATGDKALTRVAGILANCTGINVPVNGDTVTRENLQELLSRVRSLQRTADTERIDTSSKTPMAMYPIDLTIKPSTASPIEPHGSIVLAHDKCLNLLLKDILNGVIEPANYSPLTQIKVFKPLMSSGALYGGSTNATNAAKAEGLKADAEEITLGSVFKSKPAEDTYSGLQSITTPSDSKIVMPFGIATTKDSHGQRMRIRMAEHELLKGKVYEIIGTCVDVLSKALRDNTFMIPAQAVDDFVFVPGCGPNSQPLFLNDKGYAVRGESMGRGRYLAPGAVRAKCVGASQRPVTAAQRPARPAASQKSLSLRQVEALPKKELAKFVQRVVNMA